MKKPPRGGSVSGLFTMCGLYSELFFFGDFSINGMASTLGVILPHFTEKNILLKLWTPISIVTELLITYGMLRLSAVLLNPLKGKKKKKRKAVKKQ